MAPLHAVTKTLKRQRGAADTVEYRDSFERVLRSAVENFEGNGWYITDTDYNNKGQVVFESMPSASLSNNNGTYYQSYDNLGRLTSKRVTNIAGDLVIDYTHTEYETRIDAGNLTMYRTYNSRQQLVSTTDALNGVTSYAYDAMGNPIAIRDANGNTIYAQYNVAGHKQWVNDPNMGITEFTTNALGEVESETDAENNTISYVFDNLGRVTSKTYAHSDSSIPDETFTYIFDVRSGQTGCKQGFICYESRGGMSVEYTYDAALRMTNESRTLDGTRFDTTTLFDGTTGIPTGMVYPNGLTLDYDYNAQGYLTKVKNAVSGYIYQESTAMDAFGNISTSELGNGAIDLSAVYSSRTGQMLSTLATGQSGQTLLDWEYTQFDVYGNVKAQRNGVSDFTETFTYDDLHRLTHNSYGGGLSGTPSISYGYDAVGNFKYKSDYSVVSNTAYQYGGNGAGPNAVTSVLTATGTQSYTYDAKGNMTSGGGMASATYYADLKPFQINKNGLRTFYYGSDHMRYKQVYGERTTYYAGKYFEVEGDINRVYVGDIAVIKYDTSNGDSIRFALKDRLGSATTLADETGNIKTLRAFDPFGKPKGSGGEELASPRLNSIVGSNTEISRRGFTDHEHLDDAELIHMNGRVYDYNLGRFASVDPFVHGGSQGLNPYSYIFNNPLSGTDPSGYSPVTVEIDVKDIESIEIHEDGSITVNFNNGADSQSFSNVKVSDGVNSVDVGSEVSKAKRRILAASDVYNKTSKLTRKEHGMERVSDAEIKKLGLSKLPFSDEDSGFKSALYYDFDRKEYVYAMAGTEDGKDWGTNIEQGTGKFSQQHNLAIVNTTYIRQALDPSATLVTTGHSLGGGLASLAALKLGLSATTFNAAGISEGTLARYRITNTYSSRISAFYVENDILSLAQDYTPLPGAMGVRYSVPSTRWTPIIHIPLYGIYHSVNSHFMSDAISAMDNIR